MTEGAGYFIYYLPWDMERLRSMPHFEFQNWAVIALGGVTSRAKTGDKGIDGRIYPAGGSPRPADGELFMENWYPVQVKQKDKAGRPDIDSFEAVMMRE